MYKTKKIIGKLGRTISAPSNRNIQHTVGLRTHRNLMHYKINLKF
ncbi:hypothetical protein SCA05_15930 [Staphylococcus carnosus]|nr:hypothetical protein SCA05_15930 [Staphylococcus carnosus]